MEGRIDGGEMLFQQSLGCCFPVVGDGPYTTAAPLLSFLHMLSFLTPNTWSPDDCKDSTAPGSQAVHDDVDGNYLMAKYMTGAFYSYSRDQAFLDLQHLAV